jgi:hypothetical protein
MRIVVVFGLRAYNTGYGHAGGQFAHLARPIKQNEPPLPSAFDFILIVILLLIIIAGQTDQDYDDD